VILQVLVAVELLGVHARTIEARYALPDSTLELPAGELRELFGVTVPVPWVALPALEAAYPSVMFTWIPRELRLLVQDPREVLPASRDARAALLRRAQSANPFAYRAFAGPFGAVTADDSGRSLLELGYSLRGRASVTGSYLPAAHRGLWTAAVTPWSALSLSISGDARVQSATGRLAIGPTWAFATWSAGAVQLDGLVALGPVAIFASSRHSYLVTLTRAGVAVQAGRTPQQTTVRLSFGPQLASPFLVPVVPLR